MTQSLSTKTRGLLGWQEPRIVRRAPREFTMWPVAQEFLGELGLSYLPWQCDWWEECLGVNIDGEWSSRRHCSVVSRQAGKSELAIGRILVGLFLIPTDRLIIYCAHEAATAKEIFLRIKDILEDEANAGIFETSVKHIWQGNGNYGIEMTDGSRVLFKTRTKGTARGFSCDCLILDEAMFLSHLFAQSVLPSQNARENPQTIVMGSAGVGEASEYFGGVRRNAMSDAEDDGLTWMEWSVELCNDYCDESCEEHEKPVSIVNGKPAYSEETYIKANPSYGVFATWRGYEALRKDMEPEAFATECLSAGVWPKEMDAFSVIDKEACEAANQPSYVIQGRPVFAVAITPDLMQSCIVAVGYANDERSAVAIEVTGTPEIMDHRAGTKWLVPRLQELYKKHNAYAIAVDDKGHGSEIIKELKDVGGMKVITPLPHDYAVYCGKMKAAITGSKTEPRYVFHRGQKELMAAFAGLDTRKLSSLTAWARATDASVIISLEAATIGLWGLEQEAKEAGKRKVWFATPSSLLAEEEAA